MPSSKLIMNHVTIQNKLGHSKLCLREILHINNGFIRIKNKDTQRSVWTLFGSWIHLNQNNKSAMNPNPLSQPKEVLIWLL